MPPLDPRNPNYTVFFGLDDDSVIDPSVGGNEAQWINHSCEPNCEAVVTKRTIWIVALRDMQAGEEPDVGTHFLK